MDIKTCEEPFDRALIQSKPGPGGKRLNFVAHQHYVRKLNEIFAGEWSFDIIEHTVEESEVVVLGRLTAGGVVKTAFGGADRKGTSLGDTLKSAASDALKKASSLMGIGIHLYDEKPAQRRAGGQQTQNSGPTDTTVSEKQLKAIFTIAGRIGWARDELEEKCLLHWGVVPKKMTRSQASSCIKKMQVTLTASKGQPSGEV